jgi:hypothetical protein
MIVVPELRKFTLNLWFRGIRQMRRTQTSWRRRWSRKWLKKFIAISLALVAGTYSLTLLPTHAAGPTKKTVKSKATEKMARKTDDAPAKSVAKDLPKAVAENHPLKPCIAKAEASLAAVEAIKDYSAVLLKQELVQGKLIGQTLAMKVRHEPFSVYLKFEQPHSGREVIYVDGLNKGKFIVHETGFRALAGTLSFLPTSKEALAENRYPITQAGMGKMLEIVITQWQADARYQEVQVKEFPSAKVGEQACLMIETIHPQPRDYFKFHKTRLYLDSETKLPLRLEQYLWPEKEGGEPVLAEEYTYTQFKSNLGLGNLDFDKTNPAYQF